MTKYRRDFLLASGTVKIVPHLVLLADAACWIGCAFLLLWSELYRFGA